MKFTARRNIVTGLMTILLFNWIVAFVFYLSTEQCLETSNQIEAAADKRFAARDLLSAMERQIRQTRWISVIAGSFSSVSVAVAFFIIHRNFSKRHRAEEQLRENEERFGLLVERAKEYAIFRLDVDGRVQSWNAGAQRIKGYAAEEIIGQHLSVFYPPEALRSGQPEMELMIAREKGQFQGDGWRLRRDGSRFWGNVVITPLRDGRGNPVGFSEIFRDLSDQKNAEEAIAQLNKTLQRQNAWLVAANGEMEAFSYSVSHDLRAPLRSVGGFSQALLEDYGPAMDARCQDFLNRILAANRHMGQLIDALLDLSRVTRVEMRVDKVDLTTLAGEIAEELRRDFPGRVVEFVIAEGLCAEGDARLFRILLTNLLGNAWKFTERRPDATVEFGRCTSDGAEAFFVRDNGVGFDMSYSSKLFRTFQRLHSSTEFPGTGIGLATVNRIVHRHGGRVWGHGKLEIGAVFYFTLQPAPGGVLEPADEGDSSLMEKELCNVA